MTIGISNSEMARWERCPRRWFTEYYLGYQLADPAPTGLANLGIRIHTAMEGMYGYQLDPLMVIDLLYKAEIEAHPDFERDLRTDWELSRIMIEGYPEFARDEAEPPDSQLQVVATETEVRVPLPGSAGVVELRAKMDRVVQDRSTGLLSFDDTKTADNFSRTEIIEMDPQMRFYSLVQWLASGHPPPVAGALTEPPPDAPLVLGGIVTTLRRVKRTRTSRPPYYQRHPFRLTPQMIASTLTSVQQVCWEIVSARQRLDEAYAAGGLMEAIDTLQRSVCRPVLIQHDCKWNCPLATGLCTMMDDGSNWAAALTDPGRWVQGDPYARYGQDGIGALRELVDRQE